MRLAVPNRRYAPPGVTVSGVLGKRRSGRSAWRSHHPLRSIKQRRTVAASPSAPVRDHRRRRRHELHVIDERHFANHIGRENVPTGGGKMDPIATA